MKWSLLIFALAMGSLLASAGMAGEKAHWGYGGGEGPEHWADLDPAYGACSSGRNQSPIDLAGFVEAELPAIEFAAGANATEILNNGHTVQVNFPPGNSISVGGHGFDLKQVHFHTPSENTIEGRSFPMEAHFVHADADGNLAVIGVMLEIGDANDAVAALWRQMPEAAGESYALSSDFGALSLLPDDRAYYRFNGSLTTPPCSEGVWWHVMKNPVSVSEEQVSAFLHAVHHANNRPIQPVNARQVLK
jgi:carbonic anhydrase